MDRPLIINTKTARALGLTVPPSLLQRADQVSSTTEMPELLAAIDAFVREAATAW